MDDRKRMRRIFLALSGALVLALLVASAEILLPFVLGLLVAYLLLPAVLRVEQLRVPRWAAILLVYAVTLGAIAGFIALVVPSLISEGRALSRDLPEQVQHAQETYLPIVDARLKQWTGQTTEGDAEGEPKGDTKGDAEPENSKDDPPRGDRADLQIKPTPAGGFDVQIDDGVVIRKTGEETWRIERVEPNPVFSSEAAIKRGVTKATKYVTENMGELIKLGQQIVAAISRGIFNLFMTLMLGGYIMLTHEKILDFFRDLVPYESQPSFDRLLRRLDRGLSGVVRGQLIICLVNGVLSAIGFWLFDLKYWPIMAVIAAVGSLIPIFGSILSTIPAVAIGLTQSPGTAVAVLAWVVGIHQLEANFLNPKIIGDSAKIHPVLVVFSLLVGEHFFQIKGALFAVPCLSILQTLFLHFREVTMGLADPMASVPPDAPARSFQLEAIPPLRTGKTPTPPTKGKPGVEGRPPTPAPRTKPSRGSGISTTLPAGARIEDVLREEAEEAAREATRGDATRGGAAGDDAARDDGPREDAREGAARGDAGARAAVNGRGADPAAIHTSPGLEESASEVGSDGRDTEPVSGAPGEIAEGASSDPQPASSEPPRPGATSSSPATVQPTGSEPPARAAPGQEKASEKG